MAFHCLPRCLWVSRLKGLDDSAVFVQCGLQPRSWVRGRQGAGDTHSNLDRDSNGSNRADVIGVARGYCNRSVKSDVLLCPKRS